MNVKDIDFEELDRAVNSAIAQRQSMGVSNPTQVSSVSADNSISEPVPAPVVVSSPVPSSDASINLATRQTIARPATGRFMDMVHSSANMRVSVPERVPSRPAINSAIPQQNISLNSNPVKPVVQQSYNNLDSDIDKLSDEVNKTINISANDTPSSPFLSDAKVEKRPLNAYVPEQPIVNQSGDIQKTVDQIGEKIDDQNPIDTPLPAELQSDLLSIEAGEVTKADEQAIADDFADENDQPLAVDNIVVGESVRDTEEDVTLNNNVISPMPEMIKNENNKSPESSANVINSIPQQYTELPNTGEKEIGAIYDTNSYHKAMPAPVKKKAGWTWVIWISLLMIASVGAGAAVYFFVLPQI